MSENSEHPAFDQEIWVDGKRLAFGDWTMKEVRGLFRTYTVTFFGVPERPSELRPVAGNQQVVEDERTNLASPQGSGRVPDHAVGGVNSVAASDQAAGTLS